jgi:hypothetical protein
MIQEETNRPQSFGNSRQRSDFLVRLTYASRSRETMTAERLTEILEQAQRNNLARGITGILCFNHDVFVQSIEGSRSTINRLYNALLADPRHYNLQAMEMCEITERQWAEWSMGYAVPTSNNRATFLKHSPMPSFEPYAMRSQAVLKLLGELHMQAMSEPGAAAQPTIETPTSLLAKLRASLSIRS